MSFVTTTTPILVSVTEEKEEKPKKVATFREAH